MTSQEIDDQDCDFSQPAARGRWLQEIAYQLAVSNERESRALKDSVQSMLKMVQDFREESEKRHEENLQKRDEFLTGGPAKTMECCGRTPNMGHGPDCKEYWLRYWGLADPESGKTDSDCLSADAWRRHAGELLIEIKRLKDILAEREPGKSDPVETCQTCGSHNGSHLMDCPRSLRNKRQEVQEPGKSDLVGERRDKLQELYSAAKALLQIEGPPSDPEHHQHWGRLAKAVKAVGFLPMDSTDSLPEIGKRTAAVLRSCARTILENQMKPTHVSDYLNSYADVVMSHEASRESQPKPAKSGFPLIAQESSGRWGLWYGAGIPARSYNTKAEAEEHLRNVLES